ncbi:MAG: hypothetical protein QNJ46_02720 [Leptolyngbyaceae cyanobacterium MO_188.B28]|nr:hypothetical protein [Leptolyngbyaceae cyanobacterium MO_188.B28]
MSQKQLLKDRDYTFILARSPETWSSQHPYNMEWIGAQTAIINLAKRCSQYDDDGLSLYLASEPYQKIMRADVNQLARFFQNQAQSTEIDIFSPLKDALEDYFSRRNIGISRNGEMIFVILDIIPPEKEILIELIVKATERMDIIKEEDNKHELGIVFLQVGNDAPTKEFLTVLDDQLHDKGARHDIVDAKFWYDARKSSIDNFLVNALMD